MKKPDDLDPEFLNVDPLRDSYVESILRAPERFESYRDRSTALLCIDMQYLAGAEGHGVFADADAAGVPSEAHEYYFSTLKRTVLPNVRRLQDAFREYGLEIVHVRIRSLTRDGRDRSPGHKRLGLLAAPGSKEAEFLEEVAPAGDEIVIDKTASGVFNSTNLEYVLRNLGIEAVFVTGVYTDECVSTAVRDASDLGFLVTLIEDGCATVTPERQRFTVETLRHRYTRVLTTDEALRELSKHVEA